MGCFSGKIYLSSIFEHKLQIPDENTSQSLQIRVLLQLPAHGHQQHRNPLPLRACHPKRVGREIGEKRVVGTQQFSRPQQCPAVDAEWLAVILRTVCLTRGYRNDGTVADYDGFGSVGEVFRELLLDEKSVDAVIVQAAAERRHLVVTDECQLRTQHLYAPEGKEHLFEFETQYEVALDL